jgi:hypothetical protein
VFAGAALLMGAVLANTITAPVAAAPGPTMAAATPIDCASPVAPIENTRSLFNGTGYDESGSMVDLEGPAVAWRTAGATVVDGTDGGVEAEARILFSVTLDGITRQYTNGSYPVDPNYSNRTPGPADTPFGVVYLTTTGDGAVYVDLGRADEHGTTSSFRWRFDDPCDRTVPTSGSGAVPAVPQASTATYTG